MLQDNHKASLYSLAERPSNGERCGLPLMTEYATKWWQLCWIAQTSIQEEPIP